MSHKNIIKLHLQLEYIIIIKTFLFIQFMEHSTYIFGFYQLEYLVLL